MIDIKRNKGFLSVRDLYFSSSLKVAAAGEDLQYHVQSSAQATAGVPFYTSILNLAQDDNQLIAGMRKGFVYEIRRARERDGVVAVVWNSPTAEQIESFSGFFDAFAQAKGLGAANRAKLLVLSQANALVLSISVVGDNFDCWYSAHAYICDGSRARLLYSAGNVAINDAEERKVLGRANKLLHWEMIKYFKAQDYIAYDLGGISKSESLRAVDDFKLGFGGGEVLEYNYLFGVTPMGKLTAFGLTMLGKLRNIRNLRRR